MAHQPQAEAVDAPAPTSVDEKAADFENFLFPDEEEQDEEPQAEDEPAEDGDEDLELEEQQEDEDDEPETAIEPPVSLNAEEKKAFAQLPPEAQQAWAASETRRNQQVQEATTKASSAQRDAEARAAQADAEAKARYSQQLEEIGKAFVPVEPQRAWYQDDVSYLTACRQYDQQTAQHRDFMQQVADLKTEATTEADAAFLQQRDRELMAIPEVANPETRQGYLDKAFDMAAELGYDKSTLAKSISAAEVKSLVEIAGWKDKAAKFDKAMARQMQKVRSAKGKSLRPNAAPQASSRAANADQAWQRVKQSANNRTAQADAMAEWLEASGHI